MWFESFHQLKSTAQLLEKTYILLKNLTISVIQRLSKRPFRKVTLLFVVALTFAHFSGFTCVSGQVTTVFTPIDNAISEDNIREHVKFFASLDSRVPGYSGFEDATNYIVSKLAEYGVEPYGDEGYLEYYNVTVPIDHESSISLEDGTVLRAHALWPNHLNPSPYNSPSEGDKVLYVGNGTLEALASKKVENRFVLMDFNSRWHFRYAIMMGAKGVIYAPTVGSNRFESLQKLYDIPIDFPRLYVSEEDGILLREKIEAKGEITVHVRANMMWENVEVPNIVGFIKGRGKQASEAIVISAFYDSWSIVPGVSPGATDALGVSTLLELARVFSNSTNTPGRSIIILALSGHYEGLWGAREYIDRHFSELGSQVKIFAGLDLSTGSDDLGIFVGLAYGYTYYQVLSPRFEWVITKLFSDYLPQMQAMYGLDYGNNFIDGILFTYPRWVQGSPPMDPPSPLGPVRIFDSDPFTVATYGCGFTFHTTNDFRFYQNSPADTYENIKFENLWPQVKFIILSLWGLAEERKLSVFVQPSRFQSDWGYSTVKVKVCEYNWTTNYWDSFTSKTHPEDWRNTIVFLGAASGTWQPSTQAPFGTAPTTLMGGAPTGTLGYLRVVALPNKNGEVVIKGVKPASWITVDAVVIDRTDGRIKWATDLGVYAPPPFVRTSQVLTVNYTRLISVFPCGSIAVFSLANPYELSVVPIVEVYDHIAHGPMIRRGLWPGYYGQDWMCYVYPNTAAELLLSTGKRLPVAMLLNSTKDNPQGYGYKVEKGETHIIAFTPYELAQDLYNLNNERYQKSAVYKVYNPSVIVFHERANKYLDEANILLESEDYGKVFSNSYFSWAYEQQAYTSMFSLIMEVISTTIFFFLFMIPFAVILEKLVIGYTGKKRLITLLNLFVLCLLVLGFFHPGFHIATNILMVILSFGMLVVIVPLIGILIGQMGSSAKEIRTKILGLHFASISRGAAVTQAISIGIENMRKHKFTTLLTLTSIIIIVFAMVSLTSIASIPYPREEKVDGLVAYNGIYVRRFPWREIPETLYHELRSYYISDAIVAPRGWLYPPQWTGQSQIFFSSTLKTSISGFVALTPQETEVTQVQSALRDGRWFMSEDFLAVIVTSQFLDSLNQELRTDLGVGDTLNIWGLDLKIVGVADGNAIWSGNAGIVDLDQEALTPRMTFGTETVRAKPPHLTAEKVLIIPYALFERIMYPSSSPISIAVKPNDPSKNRETATALAMGVATDIYYGKDGQLSVIHPRQWFTVVGMEMMIIPIIISAITVLNMMLGAVFQRVNEIRIYNSLGLSPLHVMGLFLAESITSGVLSTMFGYLLGIIGIYAMMNMNLVPPDFYPNYSSWIITMVLGLSVGATLASSLYPAFKASKITIPSLERKWKIPKPAGSRWTVGLPFVATSLDEVVGIFTFLSEYLGAFAKERSGPIMVTTLSFGSTDRPDMEVKNLSAEMKLAPYDLGISQDATVIAMRPEDETRYIITLELKRISGYEKTWIQANRIFIDNVRKQMLIWRSLPPSMKEIYINRGKQQNLFQSPD